MARKDTTQEPGSLSGRTKSLAHIHAVRGQIEALEELLGMHEEGHLDEITASDLYEVRRLLGKAISQINLF